MDKEDLVDLREFEFHKSVLQMCKSHNFKPTTRPSGGFRFEIGKLRAMRTFI